MFDEIVPLTGVAMAGVVALATAPLEVFPALSVAHTR